MQNHHSLKSGNSPHRILFALLSFILPVVIMVLALIALHITPFGDHNLAIVDANFYINNEMWFARLMKGQENILYSLNNGLGGNEWSIFAWGGFSFGNLLSMFAKLETIPTVFTWICVFNVAICGLTMYCLLAYMSGHGIKTLIFSTSYALIGFNVVNIYQIGFVLGPEMLPLVILGLILLFRNKSPLLYILSLAFCGLLNFYFAFHLCVISLLFLIGYLYAHASALSGRKKKVFIKWLASSIIGGLLAAPVWLPAIKAYAGGGRLSQTEFAEFTFNENMPFISMFSKLFTGANSAAELIMGMPNIFCGILVIALVILYFINNRIPARRKRAAAVILVVYLLTFYLHALTLVMHGGTHTNWFPYRYSYVFSFLLICLAVEEFQYLDVITFAETRKCGIVLLVSALIVFSTSYEFMTGGAVLLDLALLLLMYLGFWYYKTKPSKAPIRTFSLLLLILVSINLYANFIISTSSVSEWELDLEKYQENVAVSGSLIDALNLSEKTFFRMEKDESESHSVGIDSLLYNYNGVSHSGPAERMFIHKGLNKLGINWYDMRHWYSEGIPAATDALLGLKYLISESDLAKIKGYAQLITMDDKSIYQSDSFLSPAILANGEACDLSLGSDIFDNLNAVWRGMTGDTADIFTHQPDVTYHMHSDYTEQTVTSAELAESAALTASNAEKDEGGETEAEPTTYIEYTLTAPADGPLYYFDTSIPDSDNGLADPAIHLCGVYKAGETVTGKIPLQANIGSGDLLRGYCVNLAFATENLDVLADYARQLNARDCSFNVIQDNHLTGEFTAEANQRILFTLPWDEGWTCTIDGQKVPIDKTWDLFMSIEAPEGNHTYEMRFTPAWLNYGLYLSAAALVGLVVLMIAHLRGRRKGKPA